MPPYALNRLVPMVSCVHRLHVQTVSYVHSLHVLTGQSVRNQLAQKQWVVQIVVIGA